MIKAGDLKKVLEHIAPDTPVLVEGPGAKNSFLHITKEIADVTAKFQKDDGAPFLILKTT